MQAAAGGVDEGRAVANMVSAVGIALIGKNEPAKDHGSKQRDGG